MGKLLLGLIGASALGIPSAANATLLISSTNFTIDFQSEHGAVGHNSGATPFNTDATENSILSDHGFGAGTDAQTIESVHDASESSGGNVAFQFADAHLPEPATWATMLIGFGAMGFVLSRRRRRRILAQAA